MEQIHQAERTVVITGASRGIGLEIARALKDTCGSLVLIASSTASFNRVRDEFGPNVSFYGADFSSSNELQELASKLTVTHPRIDVLVNNCGVYTEASFSDTSAADLEKLLDVNARAPIVLTRLLLTQLQAGKDSIVINMSSVQASRPSENLAAYAASKAALSTFSTVLRRELNPLGIRVTTMEPGGVNTWEDPDPLGLLKPEHVAKIVLGILDLNPAVQIDEITISTPARV